MGKLRRGQVVAMDRDMATRYLMANIAEQVSSGEYEEQTRRQQEQYSQRQQSFWNLNQGHSLWDVSTHRDVLTAPEDGLRRAYDAGLPLSNLQYLTDENGNPLEQDADIEDILEARKRLHTGDLFPTEMADRSSVMGGGSHYTSVVGGGPEPLTPKYRSYAQAAEAASPYSHQQQAVAADEELGRRRQQNAGGRAGRASRRAQTLEGSQTSGQGGPTPPTPPAEESK